MVEGRVVSLADLNALATLPSKEALLSKVLFLFNSPAQRVASTLSGVARNLALVISQAVKEKKISRKQHQQLKLKATESQVGWPSTGERDRGLQV